MDTHTNPNTDPDTDAGNGTTVRRLVHHLALDEGPGTIGHCREFVRRCLESCGWLDATGGDDELRSAADDVLLLASEIVTNARRHAHGLRRLTVSAVGASLRVEVVDGSAVPPALQPLGDGPAERDGTGRIGGHGLRLVDRLSRGQWGSQPHENGKTVWFEVVRPDAG